MDTNTASAIVPDAAAAKEIRKAVVKAVVIRVVTTVVITVAAELIANAVVTKLEKNDEEETNSTETAITE
jgi:hypothetical protein